MSLRSKGLPETVAFRDTPAVRRKTVSGDRSCRKSIVSELTAYRVELEAFQGPLDLLLYLVRREELDIRQLSMARIARQFGEFLEVLTAIDLDLAGEFVVVAGTLMEMKSREVLPHAEEAEDELPEETGTQDVRGDLIRQLLEYKRFKEAGAALEERAARWQERYPRMADDRPTIGKDPAADRIKEVELWDLVSALGRILRGRDVAEEGQIRYDDTPIHVYVEQIGQRVREEHEVAFSSLFDGETIRSKIVGLFLAVLELMRHHNFRAEQTTDFGEIIIRPPLKTPTPVAENC